jgi:hypothetical protein
MWAARDAFHQKFLFYVTFPLSVRRGIYPISVKALFFPKASSMILNLTQVFKVFYKMKSSLQINYALPYKLKLQPKRKGSLGPKP